MPASRRVFLSRAALSAGAMLSLGPMAQASKNCGTYADALSRIGNVPLVKVWAKDWSPANSQDTDALDLALTAKQSIQRADLAGCLPKRISTCSSREAVWGFGDWLLHLEASSFASTGFFGAEGTLLVAPDMWTLYLPDGSVEQRQQSRSISPDVNRRLSSTLLHLARISYRLGRDIRFDPQSQPDRTRHSLRKV